MSESTQGDVAREFAVARRTNGAVTARALRNLDTIAAAYRIQERVRDELGAKVVGWKLAAPPSADAISAPLFDIECLASDAVVENAELLRDGVECELALRIDRSLPGGGCTRDEVMAAVGAVMPAFELLCSRLPAKFASPREHIVADGMGQGAVVLGAPCHDWRTLELDKLRVRLWADDALVVDKQGGNPFGDPLRAVALLADHLARRGHALEAGNFVLAGSHTGVHRARPGERLRCLFEGVGQVALTLSKAEEQNHAGR
jgi:2-keto-4-pentenoate hydratase